MPLFGIFAQVPKAVVSAVAPATWPASRGALGVRPSSPNAALKQAFQHPMRHKIYCLATILFFLFCFSKNGEVCYAACCHTLLRAKEPRAEHSSLTAAHLRHKVSDGLNSD